VKKLCVLLVLAFVATSALAQTAVRIRGAITAVDAITLSVKSRDGKDLKLTLPDNVAVAVAQPVRFSEIKDGDFVGVTSMAVNGEEVAIEVHYLASTVPAGQLAWDLEPNSKMTNATVRGKVVAVGRRELTLEFTGGPQKVVVPDGIPLVRTVPGTRADLKAGEYVFVSGRAAGDGGLTAQRIQVSRDGVRPPQ